jgi:hypothetical protein
MKILEQISTEAGAHKKGTDNISTHCQLLTNMRKISNVLIHMAKCNKTIDKYRAGFLQLP